MKVPKFEPTSQKNSDTLRTNELLLENLLKEGSKAQFRPSLRKLTNNSHEHNIHMSSEKHEENGYRLDLDLLAILLYVNYAFHMLREVS